MLAAQRVTIANDLLDEVQTHMASSVVYATPADLFIKKFFHSANNLSRVDPYHAWLVRALIHTITGDSEEAMHCIRNAKHWPGDALSWVYEINVLANLGRFSEGAKVMNRNSDKGAFNETSFGVALICGAFNYVTEVLAGLPIAETLVGQEAIRTAKRCTMSLHQNGLSEDHVQKVLDLAGAVMSRHGIFPGDYMPIIHCHDDGVLYQFPVSVSADESARMTNEVIIEMIEQDLDVHEFSFRFISTQ